jgi:hypothetical protein
MHGNAASYSSAKDIKQTIINSHYFKGVVPTNIYTRLDRTFVHQASGNWPYLDTSQK